MDDEAPFKALIAERPGDLSSRKVFADWLEERGETERSKNIRERVDMLEAPSLSSEQQAAIDQVGTRLINQPYVTLGGYAGTGKSTIIQHLTKEWPDTAVAALCGKAVNVLRCKGVSQAQTIHSLIYEVIPDTQPAEFRRRDRLQTVSNTTAKRLIIDEASMVNEQMLADLLSFDVPILFVGDHGQLEPIGRESWLMHSPDVTLTTVHRQARDNPIIRLATALREGRDVPLWEDPKRRLSIVSKDRFWELLHPSMTAICAYNKTRHRINRECREKLGFVKEHPVPGDRLVCLKNNRQWGIFNGQMATCLEVRNPKRREIDLKVRLDDDRIVELPALRSQFGQDTDPDHRHWSAVTLWGFGYGLTCHKAQGSEISDVIVLEQKSPLWNMQRWSYTAATRARESLIYCK